MSIQAQPCRGGDCVGVRGGKKEVGGEEGEEEEEEKGEGGFDAGWEARSVHHDWFGHGSNGEQMLVPPPLMTGLQSCLCVMKRNGGLGRRERGWRQEEVGAVGVGSDSRNCQRPSVFCEVLGQLPGLDVFCVARDDGIVHVGYVLESQGGDGGHVVDDVPSGMFHVLFTLNFPECGPFCMQWSGDGRYLFVSSQSYLYVYALATKHTIVALCRETERAAEAAAAVGEEGGAKGSLSGSIANYSKGTGRAGRRKGRESPSILSSPCCYFVHTFKNSSYVCVPFSGSDGQWQGLFQGDGLATANLAKAWGVYRGSELYREEVGGEFEGEVVGSCDDDMMPGLVLIHKKELNFAPDGLSVGDCNREGLEGYLVSLCGPNGVEFYQFRPALPPTSPNESISSNTSMEGSFVSEASDIFSSLFLQIEMDVMPLHESLSVCVVQLSPSLSYLGLGAMDGHFGVWEIEASGLAPSIVEQPVMVSSQFRELCSNFWVERLKVSQITCIDFSSDECMVVVGSWDYCLFVFQREAGEFRSVNVWARIFQFSLPSGDVVREEKVFETYLLAQFVPESHMVVYTLPEGKLMLRNIEGGGTEALQSEDIGKVANPSFDNVYGRGIACILPTSANTVESSTSAFKVLHVRSDNLFSLVHFRRAGAKKKEFTIHNEHRTVSGMSKSQLTVMTEMGHSLTKAAVQTPQWKTYLCFDGVESRMKCASSFDYEYLLRASDRGLKFHASEKYLVLLIDGLVYVFRSSSQKEVSKQSEYVEPYCLYAPRESACVCLWKDYLIYLSVIDGNIYLSVVNLSELGTVDTSQVVCLREEPLESHLKRANVSVPKTEVGRGEVNKIQMYAAKVSEGRSLNGRSMSVGRGGLKVIDDKESVTESKDNDGNVTVFVSIVSHQMEMKDKARATLKQDYFRSSNSEVLSTSIPSATSSVSVESSSLPGSAMLEPIPVEFGITLDMIGREIVKISSYN
eukprot:Nk52_evm6s2438 gene=Nk52_evmTU6s2438